MITMIIILVIIAYNNYFQGRQSRRIGGRESSDYSLGVVGVAMGSQCCYSAQKIFDRTIHFDA